MVGDEGGLSPAQTRGILARLDGRFGLDALWLFGSTARGTSMSSSDVDLAALFRRPPVLDDLVAAGAELEATVGRPVD